MRGKYLTCQNSNQLTITNNPPEKYPSNGVLSGGLINIRNMIYIIVILQVLWHYTIGFLLACVGDGLRYLLLVLWALEKPKYKYYYLGKKKDVFTILGYEPQNVQTNIFGYFDVLEYTETDH